MGIDTGSAYTKGVLIDKNSNIIISDMVKTNNNSIEATKKLLSKIKDKIDFRKYMVVGVGVTGTSKRLIGSILNAQVIRNEISTIAKGVIELHPEIKTIMEIGETDLKIIYMENDKIKDYSINNDYYTVSGSVIHLLSKKIKENKIDDFLIPLFGNVKNNCIDVDALIVNCFNKIIGNNIINAPIMFIGGMSKNLRVVKVLEKLLNKKILITKDSEYVEALGIAILNKENNNEIIVNLDDCIFKLIEANNNLLQVI